jgi:hypothetical protein
VSTYCTFAWTKRTGGSLHPLRGGPANIDTTTTTPKTTEKEKEKEKESDIDETFGAAESWKSLSHERADPPVNIHG